MFCLLAEINILRLLLLTSCSWRAQIRWLLWSIMQPGSDSSSKPELCRPHWLPDEKHINCWRYYTTSSNHLGFWPSCCSYNTSNQWGRLQLHALSSRCHRLSAASEHTSQRCWNR